MELGFSLGKPEDHGITIDQFRCRTEIRLWENPEETASVIQVRGHGSLDQGGLGEGSKNCSDAGYVLKTEPRESPLLEERGA